MIEPNRETVERPSAIVCDVSQCSLYTNIATHSAIVYINLYSHFFENVYKRFAENEDSVEIVVYNWIRVKKEWMNQLEAHPTLSDWF